MAEAPDGGRDGARALAATADERPPAGGEPAGGRRRADASTVLAADAGAATALAPAGGAAATAVRPASAVRSPASGAGAIDAAGATAIEPPVTAVVRAGRRRPDIPGFRLLGVLGEGGMGTVYAGEQDAPRRPVAIKVLHATSTAALTRFFAEAEIMARLDHPGIAKVLEAGEADGHPYFVMERVEGVTLDAHVRAHALATPARLRLFAALCDAIHHAHVKGVIHRDLKPSNVMVRDDGRIAVLDFGIARVADGAGSSSGETRAGDLIGTPLYMSPEQARLRPDEVDARSDVYTLGVLLYELVADELPYDVRGRSLPDVARAICEAPPRPLGRHRAAWRGDLEAICDKALAKEPERRYASAAALGDDVRRHLEGATISARAPGLLEQVRRFARRRPGVTAAAAAAVVAGALFAVVVTLLWLEARDARRVAERERARVAAARDQLEERTNLLVLDQARAALATDPTAALAALATLGERGVDAAAAWAIADEAWGLGAAHAVVRGHGDEARWVEPVAGADRVVSAGYDGRALRWDGGAAAPRELARLPGRAHVARPSPDGAQVAVGGDAGVLRLVTADGVPVAAPAGLGGDVEKLAWTADGRWLAAADDRGGVLLWPRDGGATRRLDGPTAEIESLAWTADGAALVAGDDAGGVWRWERGSAAGARVGDAGAEVLAVWSDGARVQALDAAGTLHRWHVDGGGARPAPPIATRVAGKTGAFSADGEIAVLAATDGRVLVVAATGAALVSEHRAQVRSLAITRDGRRIASGADDGTLQVWDRGARRRLHLRGHRQRVRQLAFDDGGGGLASADSAGEVRRWDLDAVPRTVLAGHAAPVAHLALGAAGAEVLSADRGGELWRWRLADGGGERVGRHDGRVTGVALAAAAGGLTPVSVGGDGVVRWWAAGGARHQVGAPALALAASPDGARLAVATEPGPIALFAGDGAPGATLAGHAGGTDAVAFSPDGALLASGGQDRVVRVWAVAAPERPPVELGPVDDDVRHVVFTPGGLLVAAGDDGRVRAWAVRDGAVEPSTQRVLVDHGTAVIALGLDATATRLVTVGRDHRRIVTPLAPGIGAEAPGVPDAAPWLARAGAAPAYVLGREDGVVVVRPATARTLAELRARLPATR